MITGKNYIGSSQSAKGDNTYKTFNPKLNIANDAVFTEATEEEIDEAVTLASQAFNTYKNITSTKRANFLNAIADGILALGDELIFMYCMETGLPEGRATGERGRTVSQLRSFADLLEEGSWVGATIDKADSKPDLRKMMVPLGPVVVFGASNFALAFSTAGGDTASALAAGCPVIVKSHPMHSGTGEMVASAIIKAAEKTGMPNGVFSNLNSNGIEVGIKLVKHLMVKAVGFTGSIKGGRALYDLASKREEPIPVFAEMGSVNPVILFPEAAKKRGKEWAKAYAASITLGAGQFCTNPGLLFGIKSDALKKFVSWLSDEILEIEPSSMLHPNIASTYEKNRQRAISQAGLSVTAEYKDETKTNYGRQTVAVVDGKAFLENSTLHQEVFGPFSLVVTCDDSHQLKEIVSKLEGQLTGTILAGKNEIREYTEVIEALKEKVGRLVYNGVPTGVEISPAMQHGGPYPSSSDSRFTAVGVHAIQRWIRPVSYQDWPNEQLPDALKNENPLGIFRMVNGSYTDSKL